MNRQERHQQQKGKDREQKNKSDQAYESRQAKYRLPVNSVGLIVVGFVLVCFVLYLWTVGFVRPW